jgi:hypothetical protein
MISANMNATSSMAFAVGSGIYCGSSSSTGTIVSLVSG